MNILFIHEVDWLKKVVYDVHILAEVLSARGHNVYAIDYPDTWERHGWTDWGSLRTEVKESRERAVPGSCVTLRRPGYLKIPILSRLSAGFTHWREIPRTLREKKIDIIVLYSVPTNGLQALRAAKKYHIPVVFRSIDMLPGLIHNPVLRYCVRRMEKRVYQNADAILAITPNHSRYVTGLGAEENKVKLLPMPVDTGLFHPAPPPPELRLRWGFTEQNKVILFIGTLFNFSGLDIFLRAFPAIIEREPEARLLIVGDGPQRKKLEGIIKELKLEKYAALTGFQPYTMMPQYISLAAVCVNTFIDTKATRDIFPGKIIQYIACGKAAVVTPLLGIKTLAPDENKGIIYADGPEGVAQKTAELLADPERLRRIEQAGLEYVKETHDQQKTGAKLEAELKLIIGEYRGKSGKGGGK